MSWLMTRYWWMQRWNGAAAPSGGSCLPSEHFSPVRKQISFNTFQAPLLFPHNSSMTLKMVIKIGLQFRADFIVNCATFSCQNLLLGATDPTQNRSMLQYPLERVHLCQRVAEGSERCFKCDGRSNVSRARYERQVTGIRLLNSYNCKRSLARALSRKNGTCGVWARGWYTAQREWRQAPEWERLPWLAVLSSCSSSGAGLGYIPWRCRTGRARWMPRMK